MLAHELAHVVQQDRGESYIQRYDWGLHDVPGMADWATRERPQWIPVDDARVQELIDNAMSGAGGDVGTALGVIISERNREENCYDLNYAAADHYLFTRDLVGSGDSAFWQRVTVEVGYFLRLLIGPFRDLARTGNCPVSPPDPGVRRWEIRGIEHGRRDYERLHPVGEEE